MFGFHQISPDRFLVCIYIYMNTYARLDSIEMMNLLRYVVVVILNFIGLLILGYGVLAASDIQIAGRAARHRSART